MGVRLSRAALRDLSEATEFFAADNPDAAERVRNRLLAAAGMVLEFPGLGRAAGARRRVFSMPGTPFRLIYTVQGEDILVIRIHHGARQWPPARD